MTKPATKPAPRLTRAEWEALCAAVAYAESYWEEGHATERAAARLATRALGKVREGLTTPAVRR